MQEDGDLQQAASGSPIAAGSSRKEAGTRACTGISGGAPQQPHLASRMIHQRSATTVVAYRKLPAMEMTAPTSICFRRFCGGKFGC